jgi:hypothetical protein
MSLDVPVTEYATDDKKPVIHTLAARTLLGELEESRLSVQQKNSADDSLPDAIKQEGIRIGLEYGLASKWTSFVAVDEESSKETPKRSMSKEETDDDEDGFEGAYRSNLSSAPVPPIPRSSLRQLSLQFDMTHLESCVSGERVDDLVDKSQALSSSSNLYYMTASKPSFASGAMSQVSKAVSGVGSILGRGGAERSMRARGLAAPPPPPTAAPKAKKASSLGGMFGSKGKMERDTGGLESYRVTTQSAAAPLSARGGPPSSSSTNLTDEEKLHEIIMQQASSGAFPSNAVLARHIGFAGVDAVNDKLPQALKAFSVEIWMTILVCVYLEQKLASEKEVWEMVVEKAWAFVDTKVGVEIRVEMRKAAEDVIVAAAA